MGAYRLVRGENPNTNIRRARCIENLIPSRQIGRCCVKVFCTYKTSVYNSDICYHQETEVRAETFFTRTANILRRPQVRPRGIRESKHEMAREKGLKVGMIRRSRCGHFRKKPLKRSRKATKKFLVVEMSAGQMVEDVKLAVNGRAT